jgi:hypothetical protein
LSAIELLRCRCWSLKSIGFNWAAALPLLFLKIDMGGDNWAAVLPLLALKIDWLQLGCCAAAAGP